MCSQLATWFYGSCYHWTTINPGQQNTAQPRPVNTSGNFNEETLTLYSTDRDKEGSWGLHIFNPIVEIKVGQRGLFHLTYFNVNPTVEIGSKKIGFIQPTHFNEKTVTL